MTVKLKPCPFCGHKAEFEHMGDFRQPCVVVCTMCGARLEGGHEGDLDGSSWNHRVDRPVFTVEPDGSVRFRYRNHRGEVADRHVKGVTISVYWGRTEYHPERQPLLEAFDLDRKALWTFALKDILASE